MATNDNFGQLYRAALAENDPEKKSRLMREVKTRLVLWEQDTQSSAKNERTLECQRSSSAA